MDGDLQIWKAIFYLFDHERYEQAVLSMLFMSVLSSSSAFLVGKKTKSHFARGESVRGNQSDWELQNSSRFVTLSHNAVSASASASLCILRYDTVLIAVQVRKHGGV